MQPLPFNTHDDRVCVVGAGPAGLAIARAFKRLGIAFDVFERHTEVGGIWDVDNPGSPMYASAHFISSKTQSHFHNYAMPQTYPDYPSNAQILAYMRDFAHAYDLYQHITFETEVTEAKYGDEGWSVRLSNGEQRHYRWLICASGTTWYPSMPDWASQPFNGQVRHANSFQDTDEFKGKRVLVVGAGNSGCDIACDAAQSADKAFISLRRGYHFIPKHIFGKPADVFAAEGPHLPMWLAQRVLAVILRLLNGDVKRLGLPKPDHKIFESHPIVNSQLLHYLSHGDVMVKGDVSKLDGDSVVFTDGSRETVDLVLCATGYQWKIPYIDEGELCWSGGRPDNALQLFSRNNPNLFALGFTETNGGIYKMFDEMADLLGRTILAQRDAPADWARLSRRINEHNPDLSGGVKYVATDRHAAYANLDALSREFKLLRKHMRWPMLQDIQSEPVNTVPAHAA